MTMKKFLFALGMPFMLFGAVSLSSCSDSDGGGDGGSLETPKYEVFAAKYDITTPNSNYESIELTASGNYIVTEAVSMDQYEAPKRGKSSLLMTRSAQSRSGNNGVIFGKYTKISDTKFNLAGFGTIEVTMTGENAFDLNITTEQGAQVVLGANRDNQYESSSMTDKLCRSWAIFKVRVKAWENGKLVGEQTFSEDKFAEVFDDDEYPKNVVFTKSGTYVVFYNYDSLAVSTWCWENESKGVLRYSWDYEHLYDPYESGVVGVSFSGNQLVIVETYEDSEYGEKEEMSYYLKEIR